MDSIFVKMFHIHLIWLHFESVSVCVASLCLYDGTYYVYVYVYVRPYSSDPGPMGSHLLLPRYSYNTNKHELTYSLLGKIDW